ncbi:unnamed protein product, partial [Protopolystoma xenopodis]
DLTKFGSPRFDHKAWVNEALAGASNDQDVEHLSSGLIVKLQAYMEEINSDIISSTEEFANHIPRIS